MFESVNRPSRWRTFWPDVGDLPGAREAIRMGSWFAYLATIIGALATMTAWLSGGDVLAQLANVLVFGLIGLGIRHGWRTAAVFGAVSMGASIVGAVTQGRFPGVVAPFVFIGLINGVRGTFALKRLERVAPKDVLT